MIATKSLIVDKLNFSYGSKQVLNDVSFTVEVGHCSMLLGANGAGKSTLFALIARLYDSRNGKISLVGFDIKRQTCKALSRLGVVFQQTTLDMDLSVMQNLRYHAKLHGINRKQTHYRIQQELERLQMYDRRFEKIRQLNGGHRRRVEIARSLLHKPTLLLLDEPTIGLDVPTRQTIVEYIHALVNEQNISVLWATHLIDEVFSNDDIIVLHQGCILATGGVNELLKQTQTPDIKAAFTQLTQTNHGR